MGQACCSKEASNADSGPGLKSRRTIVEGEKDKVFKEEKGFKNAEPVKGQEEEYIADDEKFYSPNYFKVTNNEEEVEKREMDDGTTVIKNKFCAGGEINEKDFANFDQDPISFSYNKDMEKKCGAHNKEKMNKNVMIIKAGNCNVS